MNEMMTMTDECGAPPPSVADRWMRALSSAIRACLLFVFAPLLRGPARGPWRRPPKASPCSHVAPIAAATTLTAKAVAPPVQPSRGLPTCAGRGAGPVAIAVRATFAPQDYRALLAALVAPGSKLLDLRSARLIRPDLFAVLAAEWTAAPGSVPRLGFLLSFEDWAVVHEVATLQLAPLRAHGVETEVFYEEQAHDDMLLPWFVHGHIVHNVAAVLNTLSSKQDSGTISPVVLEAAASLVYQEVRGGGSPADIVGLASIALSSGARIKALAFAQEALLHLGEESSAERCAALRVLGLALMLEGKVIVASRILHGAIAMAIALGAMEDAADMLCQLGTYALDRGEVARAETKFRAAIELLQPARSALLATLHHYLAVALLHQGNGAAELHAVMALASRPDKRSSGAQMDLELLGCIRGGRGLAS